jgi:F-type H+-transporting ATPase subunit delta
MADYQAGKRYAQAAFAIASEQGTVAAWRSDLADIATVLADSQAAPLFADGRIAVARRQELAARALDVQPLALNLAKLLIQKGRAGDARSVSEAFNRMADEREGIVYAEITTAVAVEPEQVSRIEAQLGLSLGKRVRATAAVDPALLGGVVVRVGDRLIDGSVRTRLRSLRRELHTGR